ncbi:response regulator [Colwelliaceae bacterium 6441]
MSKPNLLIIDDDSSYLELLAEALEHQFVVYCADNLDAAEEHISKVEHFDIALVDENIGDEKGSNWIKQKVEQENVATSFVLYSGLATEDAILKGLECGADDFLAKPISLLALNSKLEKLIAYQSQIHQFENEINSKDRVINVSMAQASKYGSCMQLTSRLNSCFTIDKIRDEVFSYLYNMNLQGCIAFYPLNEPSVFYSSKNGFCSPVEKGVIELLKVKPRLYRFGTRTIFNHSLVSILILNLEEGAIDTDIYIDALASVIECIGARMEFITYKNSLVSVQEQIQQAVSKTKTMIEISKHHQQEVMNEIVQNMGMSFHVLDMTIEQEEYLTNLVHNALRKHSQDDVMFMEVTDLLDKALDNVDELKSLNTLQSDIEEELDDEDELF